MEVPAGATWSCMSRSANATSNPDPEDPWLTQQRLEVGCPKPLADAAPGGTEADGGKPPTDTVENHLR
ncbi:hypothetical protein E2562_038483 [Oryza meyeriana var. granulata]|uniref:Uncharacterized protein n=1 Tax=Oryza meyeriana var. granulata TaxID=110450 RepID=A0A6G1C2K7_9ORYZ|nr:hypothetical protein E2562_038483 [Oryza meyeriana var. granulata]